MAEKLYRIGDAATLLGLKSYVLRYWETEFPQLRPVRTGKGQRRYTERDMVTLRRIRYLLHEEGLTIEGARRVFSGASTLGVSDRQQAASGEERIDDGVSGFPFPDGAASPPDTADKSPPMLLPWPDPRKKGDAAAHSALLADQSLPEDGAWRQLRQVADELRKLRDLLQTP
jgi:DNA-binding transcriptional MerR regulator